MSKGFTLAEVVAAITIPSLMSSYRKKSYYTQFMKARSVIENALRMYANDYDCDVHDGSCYFRNEEEIRNFGKYFKGVQYVTLDNYKNLCAGYDKIPITWSDKKSSDEDSEGASFCDNSYAAPESDTTGFLTIDGMLLLLTQDAGYANGSTVDVNGPDSGPNVFGRDMFYFYISSDIEVYCNNMWGISKACKQQKQNGGGAYCYETPYGADDCGARLIEEGKMNY